MDVTSIDITLEKYSLYYRALSVTGKDKFVNRVIQLSQNLSIEGVDIEVTEEMEIILYAYFVQVSFGLSTFIPSYYHTVLLYQSSFIGRTGSDETAGKTYIKDKISLSWYHFSESHLRSNDGENLGFYHIGQAMVQSLISGNDSDAIFSGYFEECGKIVFLELIKNPYHDLVVQNKNAVRRASFVDFFPSILEWFFEKPEALKSELPNSYIHLCTLLNQDPLAIDENYTLNKDKYRNKKGIKPIPDKIVRSYAFREIGWLSTLPLISIILLPIFFIYYIRPNILLGNVSLLLSWIAVSLAVYFGLEKYVFARQIFKNKFWWLCFAFIGASPNLLFASYWLGNNVVLTQNSSKHSIKNVSTVIRKRKLRGSSNYHTYISHYVVQFTDNFLEEYPKAREFYPEDYPNSSFKEGGTVIYDIGTCLWGYDVVIEKDAYDPPIQLQNIE